MNARVIRSTIGSGLAAALVLGMLSALPAQGSNALCKVTHADTPYRGKSAVPPSSATTAKTQAAAGEIQVAVMVKAPAAPASKRGVFIHR